MRAPATPKYIQMTMLRKWRLQLSVIKGTKYPGVKGTVHSKMKIVSWFTHTYVVPNLVKHKRGYFEGSRIVLETITLFSY